MNWLLKCIIQWRFKQRHPSIRRYPSVRNSVNFIYCKIESLDENDINALALARYTSYDPENRALAVEQVTYQDDEKGHTEFQCQVTAALHFGIDVAVMSPYDLDYFPFLDHVVTK